MLAFLATLSILAFGADAADARPGIQAAIAAAAPGDVVEVPAGVYTVTQAGYLPCSILVPAGVRLRGPGTLRQAAGTRSSVRMLCVSGADVGIEGLTLDGNRAAQTVNEQRHGIFSTDTTGLVVTGVTARDFTGDGFYLYAGTTRARFEGVTATGNARNGITFGATVTGVDIERSVFAGNDAQQIDSEPKMPDQVVSDVTVSGCLLDTRSADDMALTISGVSTATPGRGWRVTGNEIRGGVFVIWAHDVTIAGNRIDNGTGRAAIKVQRASRDVAIVGNDIRHTQMADAQLAAVWVQGTAGSAPSRVLIAGNRITVAHPSNFGVRADAAEDVDVVSNRFSGGVHAVRLRASSVDRPFARARVSDNVFTGYVQPFAVVTSGGAVAPAVVLERNTEVN